MRINGATANTGMAGRGWRQDEHGSRRVLYDELASISNHVAAEATRWKLRQTSEWP